MVFLEIAKPTLALPSSNWNFIFQVFAYSFVVNESWNEGA
jgi:hypothetical protein